jgi:hypothetical protein
MMRDTNSSQNPQECKDELRMALRPAPLLSEFHPHSGIMIRPNATQSCAAIAQDTNTSCQYDGARNEVCYAKNAILTEQPVDKISSLSSPIGRAALYSATTAALSEAAGDILFLNGLISSENAAHVKKGTQLLMIYLTGSMHSYTVAWGVAKGLEITGLVSSENANWAGQAAGIGVNLGLKLLTPAGAAATVAGYFASYAAVRAEKAVMKACTDQKPSHRILF